MAAGALLFWLTVGRGAPDADETADDADTLIEPTETIPPATDSSETDPSEPAPEDLGPGYSLLGSAERPGRTISFVRIPSSRGISSDRDIHTITDGALTIRGAGRELSSLGRLNALYSNPGERRDYILATNGGTVVTALGEAEYLPYDSSDSPVALGEGFGALTGPDDTTVWLLTSAERLARLVDLSSGDELLTVDLTENGRVLDSAGNGLVLTTPGDPSAGFIFWTPELIQPFPGTAGAAFIGAALDTVVFALDGNFLVFDLQDLSATPRFVPNPEPTLYRTTVSPDGNLLAASVVTPITEPNRIMILDLSDGREVHRITNSIEVLFQWSSPSRLFYFRPDWPAVDLAERDVFVGVDANVVRFDDLSWWYTGLEQLSDEEADE